MPEQTCYAGIFVFSLSLSKQVLNGHAKNKNPPRKRGEFALSLRREGDSNPRFAGRRTTVFETAAFDHSAISPDYLTALLRCLSRP